METKICFRCEVEKDLSEFYKHKQMADGHLNKCKDCTRADAKDNHLKKSENPEWVESEKARGREKYLRLGYKEKQKEWDKDKPWKNSNTYKGLHLKLKRKGVLTDGQVVHHWNYNFLEDVFIQDKLFHRKLHRFLVFDKDSLCFFTAEGSLLDSKEKHAEYIKLIESI